MICRVSYLKILLENKWEVVKLMHLLHIMMCLKSKDSRFRKFDNFKVFNEKIEKDNLIDKIFKDFKPSIVLHLAAQAGVRYSIDHSDTYLI